MRATASPLLDGLSHSILETPYSAVLMPLNYTQQESSDRHESIVIVEAKVITPIRGALSNTLSFRAILEAGDSLGVLNKPILVSLCRQDNQFYFAGVGSAFAPTLEVIKYAQGVAKKIDRQQLDYQFCH